MNEICKRKVCYNAEREIVQNNKELPNDGMMDRLKHVTNCIGQCLFDMIFIQEKVNDFLDEVDYVRDENDELLDNLYDMMEKILQFNEMTLPYDEFDDAYKSVGKMQRRALKALERFG